MGVGTAHFCPRPPGAGGRAHAQYRRRFNLVGLQGLKGCLRGGLHERGGGAVVTPQFPAMHAIIGSEAQLVLKNGQVFGMRIAKGVDIRRKCRVGAVEFPQFGATRRTGSAEVKRAIEDGQIFGRRTAAAGENVLGNRSVGAVGFPEFITKGWSIGLKIKPIVEGGKVFGVGAIEKNAMD